MANQPRLIKGFVNHKWKFYSFFILFVSLIILTPTLENLLRIYLSNELSKQSGETVYIAELDIKWLQRELRLEGIQLQQLDGEPTVQINALSLSFNLPWHGRWLQEIQIDRPSIWIRTDKYGLKNFRYRQRSESSLKLEQFPWDRIEIVDGRIFHTSDNLTIEIEDIDAAGAFNKYGLNIQGVRVKRNGNPIQIDDITIAEIEVEPNRFYIPQLKLGVENISVSGFLGSEDFVNLYGNLESNLDLSAVLPERFADRLELFGNAKVILKPGGSLANPKLLGDVQTENFVINAKTKSGMWRRFIIGNIDSDWTWRKNYIIIRSLELPYANGNVELALQIYPKDNRFVANGFGTDIQFVELARVLGISDDAWVDALMDIELDVGGQMRPLEFRGNVDIMTNSLLVAAQPIEIVDTEPLLVLPFGSLSGEMWLEDQSFGISGKEVMFPETSGTFEAVFSWKEKPRLDVEWDFPRFNLSNLAPLGGAALKGKGSTNGRLFGELSKLKARGNGRMTHFSTAGLKFADDMSFSFSAPTLKDLRFQIHTARLKRSTLSGNVNFDFRNPLLLDANLTTEDGFAQDFMQIFFSLPGIDAQAKGKTKIHGEPSNLTVETTLGLTNANLWGEPFPTGDAVFWYQNKQLSVEKVSFERESGTESLLFRGSLLPNGESNFETRLANLSLGGLSFVKDLGLPLGGNVNGRIFLQSRNGEISPTGLISLSQIRYDQQRLSDGEIRFFEDGDQIQFRGGLTDNSANITGLSGYSTTEPYQFAIDLNSFPIHIFYPRTIKGSSIFSTLSGNMKVSGKDGGYRLDAKIDKVLAEWRDTKVESIEPFKVTRSNDGFGVKGLTLIDNHDTNLTISARTFNNRPNVQINGVLNLPIFEDFVPGLTQAAGSAVVKINSDGRLRDAAKGTVYIPDGYIAGTWFPHPLEDINAKLSISPDSIQFSDVTSRLGGGELSVSGEIINESFLPTGFDLELDFKEGQLKLMSDLPPIYGDAQLSFKGPLEQPILSGDVQIQDMQFIERIDWEDWLLAFSSFNIDSGSEDTEEEYFRMDVSVTSDNHIRVRNNLGDLHASADLQLIGTLTHPGMRGVVQVEPGGRALLKERDFSVLRGELRFVDPYSFDPEVDISMNTTVRSLEQDIEIQYYVSGLYSSWITQTTSNPPLPQADINSLLLLGMTRDQLERFGGLSSALIVEGGDLIASKFGVVERFNKVSEGIFQAEILRFDRMDIISGASMSGGSSMNSTLRLLAEKDLSPDSTLSVEQSFNSAGDIYVSLEQRLAERVVSEVFWGTEQNGRYLNIGGAYGASLRLRWEFE